MEHSNATSRQHYQRKNLINSACMYDLVSIENYSEFDFDPLMKIITRVDTRGTSVTVVYKCTIIWYGIPTTKALQTET